MKYRIASELGIPAAKLASMDSKKIKKLMESGDLDPSQKARLVRAHLEKAMESLDLVGGFLSEPDPAPTTSTEPDDDID